MTIRHNMLTAVSAVLTIASGACTISRDHHAADSTSGSMQHAVPATGATTSAMPGMTDTMGNMGTGTTAMMDEMRQHLQTMRTMSPDRLKALLPTHRQMVANMMATMNTEMRDMHMPGDAAWQATVDSLRSDLIHLPTMNTAEIHAFLPAHAQRVTHLMQMHHDMMANMKMQ